MAKRSGSVTSHTAKPKEKEFVKGSKDDPMMIGFQFEMSYDKTKTPYDFLNEKKGNDLYRKTGGRVFGTRVIDLRQGIEGATLPPLAIWDLGQWWGEFTEGQEPFQTKTKLEDDYLCERAWVTDGQGTPGAYMYCVFILPEELCNDWAIPKHPQVWKKALRDGKAPPSSYVNEKAAYGWSRTAAPVAPPKPATPAPYKAPPLPVGVRFRCKCGHWFSESDLRGHSQCCPAGAESIAGQSDWAILCDKNCGCEVIFGAEIGEKTLDHVGQCKPGFPRPAPEPTKEVKSVSEPESEPQPEPKPEPSEPTPAPVA